MSKLFLSYPLVLVSLLGSTATAAKDAISYNRDVRPIVADKCFACHGPDNEAREAELRLDDVTSATADRGGYAAIVPGDPENSEVILRITADDPDMRMPPADSHKFLSEEEIGKIRRWIAAGAKYQKHWAYEPIQRPEVPHVAEVASQNPVDAFVLRAIQEHDLHVEPRATKNVLVRRAYLDLLGVSPAWSEVQAFVNDDAADAWPALISRLLDDPRFGERMAVFWLDLVRYADTIGYHSDNYMEVSAYRDYVIQAFNENLPFDQFTVEQLAGDLLPHPTDEQLVASGYNRLLQTTEEGGAQPKEYQAIYAADRVRNVSGVWLGSTMGCAQCHDHKYDPFLSRDFYSMAAFFADIDEQAVGHRQPNMVYPTADEKARAAELQQELARLKPSNVLNGHPSLNDQVKTGQKQWEQQIRAQSAPWLIPHVIDATSGNAGKIDVLSDGSALLTGPLPDRDVYRINLLGRGTISSIRLQVLSDPSFPIESSLSPQDDGSFVLTGIEVVVEGQPIAIATAIADSEQQGFEVSHVLDADAKTGWSPQNDKHNHEAVFVLQEPLDLGDRAAWIEVKLHQESDRMKHLIGRFRLSISAGQCDDASQLAAPVPEPVLRAVLKPAAERNVDQADLVDDYYRSIAPALSQYRSQRAHTEHQLLQLEKSFRTTLVAKALPEPRTTRILNRGNWQDETGEIVLPATPAFLPHPDVERRLTRLDLAHWIVADSNPLTARTFVNRLWKLFFGRGLSRNLDDLGGQGAMPTHPELLDWLAAEFRSSGWDVKHLVELMMNSAAYQRRSTASAGLVRLDPNNVWYARQGRWRIEAEFVRDSALRIGGLLVTDRIGGRSVKPYQPAGYWRHLNFPPREWETDTGEDLYRRTLYTFWCRTFLHPSLLAFDAPTREECTAERARSNTPQQALVLLNDPIFVEAARALAQQIVQQNGTTAERINWACREAFCREATLDEITALGTLYDRQHHRYESAPKDAKALIEVGASKVSAQVPAVELAAWTQVARAILGCYETTARF